MFEDVVHLSTHCPHVGKSAPDVWLEQSGEVSLPVSCDRLDSVVSKVHVRGAQRRDINVCVERYPAVSQFLKHFQPKQWRT